MRPYWWGFAMFFTYLTMIAVIGLLGATPIALTFLYVVVYLAAGSTMDSFLSAVQLTAGKQLGIAIGFICICSWLLISKVGLLDAWLGMFFWYPFIFGWQLVTAYLEHKQFISLVNQKTIDARDSLPLIENEHLVSL